MDLSKYEFQSPFGRKFFGAGRAEGRAEGRDEGRVEGRNEGRAEGQAEGRNEGRDEGRQLGHAEAILAVLAARAITYSDEDRTRIETCRDLDALRGWLARAAVVSTIAEVFR